MPVALLTALERVSDQPEHGRPWDEDRAALGVAALVTLEGHFEEGPMPYEVWKWIDTGDVEFHLRAVSRRARSGPLAIRLGFGLFGRTQQLRFYQQIRRRLRRLTEAELETRRFDRPGNSSRSTAPLPWLVSGGRRGG